MLKHSYHARLSLWHVVLAVILLALSLPLLAAEPPAATLDRASRDMTRALDTFAPVIGRHPGYVVSLAGEYLAPHVDMDTAARLALGRHWRTATPHQRVRFREEFRRLLLRNYSLLLAGHLRRQGLPRYTIEFRPATTDRADTTRVRSVFRIPHRPDTAVDYAMRRTGGQWKVYDVSVGGVSLLHTYRAVFESRLRSVTLDDLIDHMAHQNRRPVAPG